MMRSLSSSKPVSLLQLLLLFAGIVFMLQLFTQRSLEASHQGNEVPWARDAELAFVRNDVERRAEPHQAGAARQAEMLRLGLVRPVVLSWSPRITLFENFLSYQECDRMMEMCLGEGRMQRAMVADEATGQPRPDSWRNSSSCWLAPFEEQLPFMRAIAQRISHISMVPPQNHEPAQLLRYESGQYYREHEDYLRDEVSLRGGQRVATLLMYLTDVTAGGETWFPKAQPFRSDATCQCGGEAKRGLSVSPMRGDAVLFWNTHLNGTEDERSAHASCKVLEGAKWTATKWLGSMASAARS